MREFNRFTSSDLKAVADLLGETQERGPDQTARIERLMRGVAKMIHAQVGIFSELHNYVEGRRPRIEPRLDFGWAGSEERAWNMRFFEGDQLGDPLTNAILPLEGKVVTRCRQELVADRQWYQSANVMELRRRARIDHCIYSNRFSSPGEGTSLAFHRPWGDPPFTDRECALVEVLHACQRVCQAPARPALPLSPRQQQVLEALLSGDSEKQVANKLNLSRHTVHVYVKAIYERFGVCSRGELLSRWVRSDPADVVTSFAWGGRAEDRAAQGIRDIGAEAAG